MSRAAEGNPAVFPETKSRTRIDLVPTVQKLAWQIKPGDVVVVVDDIIKVLAVAATSNSDWSGLAFHGARSSLYVGTYDNVLVIVK